MPPSLSVSANSAFCREKTKARIVYNDQKKTPAARLILLISFLALSASACASSQNTASMDHSSVSKSALPRAGTIFDIDEYNAYQSVYSALQEVYPESRISVLTFPTRGYSLRWLAPPFYLDFWNQIVKIHRVSGIDAGGIRRTGFLVDLSGSGTSFLQGRAKSTSTAKLVLEHLSTFGEAYQVENIQREEYTLPQERIYIDGSDTPRIN